MFRRKGPWPRAGFWPARGRGKHCLVTWRNLVVGISLVGALAVVAQRLHRMRSAQSGVRASKVWGSCFLFFGGEVLCVEEALERFHTTPASHLGLLSRSCLVPRSWCLRALACSSHLTVRAR